MVHRGFAQSYASIGPRVVRVVAQLTARDEGEGWRVFCTGHSLGGALATLGALDLSSRTRKDGSRRFPQVQTYNFGSPRVGNAAFAAQYDKRVPVSFRLANPHDIVCSIPKFFGYRHVGYEAEIQLDGRITLGTQKALDGFGDLNLQSVLDPATFMSSTTPANAPAPAPTPATATATATRTDPDDMSNSAETEITEISTTPPPTTTTTTTMSNMTNHDSVSSLPGLLMSMTSRPKIPSLPDLPLPDPRLLARSVTGKVNDEELRRIVDEEMAYFNAIKDGSALEEHMEEFYLSAISRALDLYGGRRIYFEENNK
jgi:hypothetical protein